MAQTIKIPAVGELLTARPKGMDYETYKAKRTAQNKFLRGYNRQGFKNAHILGRLEGVLIPPSEYRNSQDPQIVITK